MKKMLVLALAAMLPAGAYADEAREALGERLASVLRGKKITRIQPTPAAGIYEVTVGAETYYATSDGKYLLIGNLFDTERGVSLAREKKAKRIATAIESVPPESMIVYGPAEASRYITVFTDIDCGYCRRFHRQMVELNQAGLQVRYLMFPRAGIGSESYDKAVSVWCADDPLEAMTKAKAGQTVDRRSCENPIADQYKLGLDVGVRGTPTMVFDDGSVVPGYLPTKRLLAQLGM